MRIAVRLATVLVEISESPVRSAWTAADHACGDGESERHILQQSGPENADSGAEQRQRQRVEHHHAVQYRRLITSEVLMPPAEKAEEQYDDDRQQCANDGC